MDIDISPLALRALSVFTPASFIGFLIFKARHALQIKSQRRKEVKYIEKFVSKLSNSTHPFIIEKWYQSITNDKAATAEEIKILMSAISPTSAMRKYTNGRSFLYIDKTEDDNKVTFNYKPKYASNRKRKLLKLWYLFLYALFFAMMMSPLLALEYVAGETQAYASLAAFSLWCGFMAFIHLNLTVNIRHAEELVEMRPILKLSTQRKPPARKPNSSLMVAPEAS